MVDETMSTGESEGFHCPWCSAVLPSADLEDCPSCGATLTSTSTSEAALPGVTAIDHEAIARNAREAVRQPRSRLLSWLSGEYDEEAPAPSGAIAPPDAAVRREMLRLRMAAEIADRQAEADAMMADAALAGHPMPSIAAVEDATPVDDAAPVGDDPATPPPAAQQAADDTGTRTASDPG